MQRFKSKDSLNNPSISGRLSIKAMQNRRFSTIDRRNSGGYSAFPASRAHLAHTGQQSPTGQPQIGRGKQRDDLRGVLIQSTIANLHEAELALDDPGGNRAFSQSRPYDGHLCRVSLMCPREI